MCMRCDLCREEVSADLSGSECRCGRLMTEHESEMHGCCEKCAAAEEVIARLEASHEAHDLVNLGFGTVTAGAAVAELRRREVGTEETPW